MRPDGKLSWSKASKPLCLVQGQRAGKNRKGTMVRVQIGIPFRRRGSWRIGPLTLTYFSYTGISHFKIKLKNIHSVFFDPTEKMQIINNVIYKYNLNFLNY